VAEAIRDGGKPHTVLEVERDNFRAALEWAAGSGRDAVVRRLVLVLHPFWFGHLAEAKGWIDHALAGAAEGSAGRNRLLMLAAQTSILRGEFTAAERHLDAALELARALGDVERQAQALIVSGNCKYAQGDLDEAARLYARSAVLSRRLGNQMGLSGALSNLGGLALERGDLEKAASLLERALALKRNADDPELTYVLCELAWLSVARNELSRATAYAHEALTTASEAPKHSGASRVLQTSFALEVVACVEAATARVDRAARLLGASENALTAVGRTRVAIDSERQLRAISQVRAALGESRFDRAWRDGLQMSLDEAVAYALASDSA
jgi:tetratricopeptide (TPR) repeat protein